MISRIYGILKKKPTELIDTEHRLVVARAGGEGGQKGQTSSHKITKSWDVMCSMVTTVNTTVLYI